MKSVGYHRIVERSVIHLLGISQTLVEVGTSLAHPCWHVDEGEHLLVETWVVVKTAERLDEHIDTLIAELIATRGADDEGVVRELTACQGIGKTQNEFA
jgi:hypothetical protein